MPFGQSQGHPGEGTGERMSLEIPLDLDSVRVKKSERLATELFPQIVSTVHAGLSLCQLGEWRLLEHSYVTHILSVLLLQPISETHSWTYPEVCLPGDSKCSQVDSEAEPSDTHPILHFSLRTVCFVCVRDSITKSERDGACVLG